MIAVSATALFLAEKLSSINDRVMTNRAAPSLMTDRAAPGARSDCVLLLAAAAACSSRALSIDSACMLGQAAARAARDAPTSRV